MLFSHWSQYMPVYTPSQEEKADPNLYADNVQKLMAKCVYTAFSCVCVCLRETVCLCVFLDSGCPLYELCVKEREMRIKCV